MSDDSDLVRLFAEQPDLPADDAFVAGVTARLARRRRLAVAAPFAVVAALLLAVWASWPATRDLIAESVSGIALLAGGVGSFFNSAIGVVTAAALLLAAALSLWASGRRALR
ncbi:MAG: hypothetical protein WDN01_13670 [Rhizomicrobium sp.]